MKAIWDKIIADLFRRRVVSILMIGTISIAATLLTLALSTLMNLGGPYDRIFKDVNGAHLWLFFKPGLVNATDINRFEKLPGVVGTTGWQFGYVTPVRIQDSRVWVTLRLSPPESQTINRLYWLEGRDLLPKANEVLAEKYLRDAYKLVIGDTIIMNWEKKN